MPHLRLAPRVLWALMSDHPQADAKSAKPAAKTAAKSPQAQYKPKTKWVPPPSAGSSPTHGSARATSQGSTVPLAGSIPGLALEAVGLHAGCDSSQIAKHISKTRKDFHERDLVLELPKLMRNNYLRREGAAGSWRYYLVTPA